MPQDGKSIASSFARNLSKRLNLALSGDGSKNLMPLKGAISPLNK
ncbi:hypothetical protein yinte0001_23210 [Yersinia intermedia ATCC 29909]|jgi:hypothetical protein|nr:hypothetical protein yinte0001_23210 [Yersinia intermedia ATCC 29909]